ncbi:Coiled-coil domain-containing protein 17 [Trichoplax sp. H2]|nr:Coiled-coil domain-containing protein 17 [Trichoplax sp. H2]|eukprot:RDD40211.1 Coiled-coil domain-containing protein 17 [Trichoplax sp. H2]
MPTTNMEIANELQESQYACQDCQMLFTTAKKLQIHKNKFCIGSDIGDPFQLKKGAIRSGKKQEQQPLIEPNYRPIDSPSKNGYLSPDAIVTPRNGRRNGHPNRKKAAISPDYVLQSPKTNNVKTPIHEDQASARLRRRKNQQRQPRSETKQDPHEASFDSDSDLDPNEEEIWKERKYPVSPPHRKFGRAYSTESIVERHLKKIEEKLESKLARFTQEIQDLMERDRKLSTSLSDIPYVPKYHGEADAPPHYPRRANSYNGFNRLPLNKIPPTLRENEHPNHGHRNRIDSDPHEPFVNPEYNKFYRDNNMKERKQVSPLAKVYEAQEQLRTRVIQNEEMMQSLIKNERYPRRQQDNRNGNYNYDHDVNEDLEIRTLKKKHSRKLIELKMETELIQQQAQLNRAKKLIYDSQDDDKKLPFHQNNQFTEDYRNHHGPRGQIYLPPVLQLVHHPSQLSMAAGNQIPADPYLEPGPYDPSAGLAIVWDFVTNLHHETSKLRVISGIYQGYNAVSDITTFPIVNCRHAGQNADNLATLTVLINNYQVIKDLDPSTKLSLLVEVQSSKLSTDNSYEALTTIGWSKVDLFDPTHRLLAGRWKVPIRVSPVRFDVSTAELNSIKQASNLEIYFRIANGRDHSRLVAASTNINQDHLYKYPTPMMLKYIGYGSSGRDERHDKEYNSSNRSREPSLLNSSPNQTIENSSVKIPTKLL